MTNNKSAPAAKLILIFGLLTCAAMSGCRKSSPTKPPANEQPPGAVTSQADTRASKQSMSKAIEDIIANRRTWNPILANFYGKEMPDFKLKDINDKTHSLSDYRGKNVMVVLWATWCQPCLLEIPHLVALREIMPADKVAILAISNEPADTVKATAQSEGMNYTVISHRSGLPEPFSLVKGIPTTFFIRPDGTLKLVVEGGSQLGEMKAIILAE